MTYDEYIAFYSRARARSAEIGADPDLIAALSATIGYMTNAKITLQTGTKAQAARTLEQGIKLAQAALDKSNV